MCLCMSACNEATVYLTNLLDYLELGGHTKLVAMDVKSVIQRVSFQRAVEIRGLICELHVVIGLNYSWDI